MSDQNPQAPESGPDANTPDTGTGIDQQVTDPYEPRYKELQSEFTRATQDRERYYQEAQQYQQLIAALQDEDPDIRQQAAELLGVQIAEPDTQHQQQDPGVEQLRQEWREFQQSQQEARQQAEQEQQLAQYHAIADKELEQLGVPQGTLRRLIAETALTQAQNTGSDIDFQAAVNEIQGGLGNEFAQWDPIVNQVKKSWQQTKPTRAVTGPTGVQATHIEKLDTRAKKADYISQLLAETESPT